MTILSDPPIVVVYGGNGFFRRLILKDLLVRTTARLVLASRRAPRAVNLNPRVSFTLSDLNDPASVRSTLAGASVVVHCAGPYQSQAPTVMHQAIASHVHYIDLAEDREFVREAQRSNEAAANADVSLLSGLSVVPGLAALFAGSLMGKFDEVLSIRTFVAPATRGSRGTATIRSLLGGAGQPLHLLREGREVTVRGWSEPEWIEFPPPLGWRLEYLAIENADRDFLARECGAERVEFKAGSECPWLNRSLAAVSRWRALTGFPSFDRWANPIRICLGWLGRFGTDSGGVIVEVVGRKNGRVATEQIALVADREGERIPALLAAIAVGALLRGELTARGALPLSSWISTKQLFHEFHDRGLRLWAKSVHDASWRPLPEMTET